MADPSLPARRALIASDRVLGTEIRRPDGTKLGHVVRLMIDKLSGRVAYVVISFGGFLGLGEEYRVLPWSVLTFDPRADAYILDIDPERLREAPPRSAEGGAPEDEPLWEEHVHRYYNTVPDWGL